MIRVVMNNGGSVEVTDRTLTDIETFMENMRKGTGLLTMRATGKLGETLLIKLNSVAYVAQYKDTDD